MNAIYLYRVANLLYRYRVPLLPRVIKVVIFLVFNSVIPYTCEIGARSRFAYGAIGVVVHSKAKIGRRVIIGQGVTIGRQLEPEGVPQIGDDVYIASGARILGQISVGNNVIVGANAVVIRNVPDNCIVAGVPARVLRTVDVSIYSLLGNIDLS